MSKTLTRDWADVRFKLNPARFEFFVLDPFMVKASVTHRNTHQSDSLKCSIHRDEDWCPHIEHLLLSGMDAEMVWTHVPPIPGSNPEPPELQGRIMDVPLFPTMDLWGHVGFSTKTESGAYKVHVVNPKDSSGTLAKIDSEPFLGFFDQGEGRMVLRGMLFDWFRTEYLLASITEKMECKSPRHSFAAEQEWFRDIEGKNEQRRLAQMWSVFTMKRCLVCAGKVGNFSTTDPDLIPDAGGGRKL